ncbi:MAG: hypothetical protein M1814_003127 [Vezdaea aestivalis]|nr:MAG: hypothetical protein M1814_003127 [Vezdaea aestivalis]
MATESLQYPVAPLQNIPSTSPVPPQHKRTYQACIPCRKRKVRCDLGSVDNPHDPPCVRCRRESKECYFSATRRKRKPNDDTGSGEGEYEDEFEIRNGRKRIRSRSDSPPEQRTYERQEIKTNVPIFSSLSSALPKAPLTPGGSIGRPQPLRRPQSEALGTDSPNSPSQQYASRVPRQLYGTTVHTPSTAASGDGLEDDPHITNSTAAALIKTEVYNGHDALNLLFEAAGQTGDIGHRRIGSHGSSQQSPIAGSKTFASHERILSNQRTGISQNAGQSQIMGPPRSLPAGPTIDPVITNGLAPALSDAVEDSEFQTALKAWAKFRFIRAGWFSAREAIAYVDYFYTYLAPLTPINPPDFQAPATHATMISDEPILTVTLLTVSSRYMRLQGPGGLSRSYAIHEKLWTYLRGMIERMIWGQEQFGGGLRAAAMMDDSEDQTSSTAPWRGARKGNLRTLGTVESLMLLTEWHPRALHFPPGDDGDELVVRDDGIQQSNYQMDGDDGESSRSRGIGGKRLESYLEPAWRSDRMCWMLMGNAMALSFELGVFDDVDETSPNAGEQHRPEYGQESYRIRAKRVQKLLVIFVTQLAGRLEWNSNMVPQHISSSVFPKIPSPQQHHVTVKGLKTASRDGAHESRQIFDSARIQGSSTVDNVLHCWLGIANLMKRGNELMFRNKQHTRDIIRSGRYVELLNYFQPMLREWRENFKSLEIPTHLRHIISIEGEYVRMYINSLALQAVVERLTNNANNENLNSNISGSTGSASPNARSVPGSMNASALMSLYGGDHEFVKEVIEASRNLLSIVVEGLLPQDYLKHCPIRTYFRIISGAMFLLKTFALGATEDEVAISLGLMDSTVHALRSCVVDDVHMGTRFADLLATLTSRIRARFVRMTATTASLHKLPVSGPNGSSITSSRSPAPPRPASRSPAPPPPQTRGVPAHPPQYPDHPVFPQAWPTYDHSAYMHAPDDRQLPMSNPLFGISTESIDLSGGNISIMPPPSSFGFSYDGVNGDNNGNGTPNNGNDGEASGVLGQGHGPLTRLEDQAAQQQSVQHGSAGAGNGYVQDWLALPLDPLLQYGAGVSQTELGPDVGGYDMLEILLASNDYDGQGNGVGMS